MGNGYKSTDLRRVDEFGRRQQPVTIPGLRGVDFRVEFRGPVDAAFRYFRAQLEHLPTYGIVWPKSGQMPAICRGLLVSTQQMYAAVLKLMADAAPQPLALPATVVARAMLEGLGNALLLLQSPSQWKGAFLRDCYRSDADRLAYSQLLYPGSTEVAQGAAMLAQFADALHLTDAERADPKSIQPWWPMPAALIGLGKKYAKKGPLLAGERLSVFRSLYDYWYAQLSTTAHHRVPALQLGVYTEEQPDEGQYAMLRSAIATLAIVVVLSLLSEIEDHFGIPACVPLRVAWERVRVIHDLPQSVFAARYERLLSMPPS